MKKTLLILFAFHFSLFTVKAQIITTIAGGGTNYPGDGGPATAAEIGPNGIAINSTNDIFIADYEHYRIRKVDAVSGIITTIVGNGIKGYVGDGGNATSAEIGEAAFLVFDRYENMYISDFGYDVIREITTSGIITTIAGTGTASYSGDGGAASLAELNQPQGVAIDASNNLFIADYSNCRVRKVNSSGIITTVVGNGVFGTTGDGGAATSAEINRPDFISFDASNNLYIMADNSDHRVRKVNNAGIITTVAGIVAKGYSGNGGPAIAAELDDPDGVAFDALGNMYIADEVNQRIREVNTAGIITTIAGNGYGAPSSGGFSGDGGPPIDAEFFYPISPLFDNAGNLYFTDGLNYRIRKITGLSIGINTISNFNTQVLVFPNPNNGIFTIAVNNPGFVRESQPIVKIYNMIGEQVFTQSLQSVQGDNVINISNQPAGIYFVSIHLDNLILTKKLVIIN